MMNHFYNFIRPFITRGDIQNNETVSKKNVAEEAVKLEEARYSLTKIMNYFNNALDRLMKVAVEKKSVRNALDVGCADGEVIAKLALKNPKVSFVAIDIMEFAISIAKKKFNKTENLMFEKRDFINEDIEIKTDLITCLQTIEHIEDKFLHSFIDRLFHTAKKVVILTVPNEPFWCLANIIRFKYWSRLGNSPHHIQHWTKKSFENFVKKIVFERWGEMTTIITANPIKLWTMILFINNNS